MTVYVLLTDDDNDTLLVECSGMAEAQETAAAAVFSDGGVSAWLLPGLATPASDLMRAKLREGYSILALRDEVPMPMKQIGVVG